MKATGPLGTVVAKGYWNLAILRAEKAAILVNSPFQKCRKELEFILKGSGESSLCIAFVGF